MKRQAQGERHRVDSQLVGSETETRLSPLARPNPAPSRPLVVPPVGTLAMSVCYLRDDNQIDAEWCRISLHHKSPITLFTLDGTGRTACVTGVVQSVQFDPNRAMGMRWRVEIDLLTVVLRSARRRQVRQRTS
jgi:hypothetical protein